MKTALISVFDKTNVCSLANFLIKNDYKILSSGGTANILKKNNISVIEISEYTKMPEILGGRVKTLHPKIYGGILNRNNNDNDQKEIEEHSMSNIDVVAVNLYPFEKENSIENIDIGGVSLIRASAKNYNDVFILTNPLQYDEFMVNYKKNNLLYKKNLAKNAFMLTSNYDLLIKEWLDNGENKNSYVTNKYRKIQNLKYGCNPHQSDASLYTRDEEPFIVMNGNLGYINTLDAINSWKLVNEIKRSINIPAATSFKHVSPAGVALGKRLSNDEYKFLDLKLDENKKPQINYSPIALAYLRARSIDPKSSFGDFIAVNSTVDITLANVIKGCVSDGIIAPDYDENAFEILKNKKNGNYLILKGKPINEYEYEYREFGGVVLEQQINNHLYTKSDFNNIVTKNKNITEDIKNDMILGMITMKYTQSNSVGYVYNGQVIGIGAGQQSRIDCTILARSKAEVWLLRHHEKIYKFLEELPKTLKKQEKINSIIKEIAENYEDIKKYDEVIKKFNNIILVSDGFFPFGDSIVEASKIGVTHVVQPGGSVCDVDVTNECDTRNICMTLTNVRAFHH